MKLRTRKVVDRYFSAVGVLSILLMTAALVVLLGPIFYRGFGAFVFRGTVEHRRLILEKFGRGDRGTVRAEVEAVANHLKAVINLSLLEGSLLERRGISAPGRGPVKPRAWRRSPR